MSPLVPHHRHGRRLAVAVPELGGRIRRLWRPGARVIDVSNVNPADLETLKASGAVAVICKATEGLSFRDRTYSAARSCARRLGLPFGGYLFLHANTSGTEQARAFLRYAQPRPGDLQPAIDTESRDGESWATIAARVDQAAHELERHRYRPLLYGSTSWLEELYAVAPQLRRLRVWQAEYPSFLPSRLKLRLRLRHHFGHGVTVPLWQFSSRWPIRGRRFDMSYALAPLEGIRVPEVPA